MRVFADTSFWIAVLDNDDQIHNRAIALSSAIVHRNLVTTDMDLTETLNHFSRSDSYVRKAAADAVDHVLSANDVRLVLSSRQAIRDAVALYRNRGDKTWALTDCRSFQVMNSLGLIEALTHDRHFEQAGFFALLRGQ